MCSACGSLLGVDSRRSRHKPRGVYSPGQRDPLGHKPGCCKPSVGEARSQKGHISYSASVPGSGLGSGQELDAPANKESEHLECELSLLARADMTCLSKRLSSLCLEFSS